MDGNSTGGGTKLVGVKLAVSFSVVNSAGILLTLERSQQQDYYLLVQVSFRLAQEERQETYCHSVSGVHS